MHTSNTYFMTVVDGVLRRTSSDIAYGREMRFNRHS